MKTLRLLFFIFIGTISIILFSSIYVLTQTISDEPLVVDIGNTNTQTLISLKEGAKAALKELNSRKKSKVIGLRHDQISELLIFLNESFPFFSARYNYSNSQLFIVSSIKLPKNIFGEYLNISLEFTDNKNLTVGRTNIGQLSFNNSLMFDMSFLVATVLLDNDIVTVFRQLLESTTYSAEKITLTIPAHVDVNLLAKRIENHLKNYREISLGNNQSASVQHYYAYLVNLSAYTNGINEVPLTEYLAPLFDESKRLSVHSDPAAENSNALLALALFAGDYNLRVFLGKYLDIELKNRDSQSNITLANRQDTLLHFLYSAIIQVLGNQFLSGKIGELKEIIDMDSGGSGFSFIDLAADRAGIAFAVLATDKPGGASRLQLYMSKNDREGAYLPDFIQLQENLNLSVFEFKFENINSAEYLQVVNEIDRRISLLALYNSSP